MMYLFQWGPAHQAHYVVATDYGDAEKTIKDEYGVEVSGFWAKDIESLTLLGSYVQVSKSVLAEIEGVEE